MIQWHGWSNKSNYWWWWSVHRFLLTIIWDWSLYKRWLLKICIKWPISWHIFPVSVAWMLVHHRFTPNIKFTVTYSIYSWVESHCERNASSQKHYTVSPAAAKTQTARIRVKHTNPETIAFPCCLTGANLIRRFDCRFNNKGPLLDYWCYKQILHCNQPDENLNYKALSVTMLMKTFIGSK